MVEVDGKRIFLSGPVTGITDNNRREFEQTKELLVDETNVDYVYDPVATWSDYGEAHGWTREQYMQANLMELMRMRNVLVMEPWYDLVVQLPGWKGSLGCMTEFVVARAIGIPCVERGDVMIW